MIVKCPYGGCNFNKEGNCQKESIELVKASCYDDEPHLSCASYQD